MKPLHNLILKHNFIKLLKDIEKSKIKSFIALPPTIIYKIPEIILIHNLIYMILNSPVMFMSIVIVCL